MMRATDKPNHRLNSSTSLADFLRERQQQATGPDPFGLTGPGPGPETTPIAANGKGHTAAPVPAQVAAPAPAAAPAHPLGAIVSDPSQIDLTKPRFCRCVISPEQAAVWLDANLGNRLIRPRIVGFYARLITGGEWQHDHPAPIVFSDRGRLIDGQHRLAAIVEADQEITARVEFGAVDAMREYIDTGINRTLEDRVTFLEERWQNRWAARLVTILWFTEQGQRGKPTADEARATFEAHRKAITWLATHWRVVPKVSINPVNLALVQFFERACETLASEFYDTLTTTDGPVQPARFLRDWLLLHGDEGGRAMFAERYAKTVAACKAYRDGRNVAVLRAASW